MLQNNYLIRLLVVRCLVLVKIFRLKCQIKRDVQVKIRNRIEKSPGKVPLFFTLSYSLAWITNCSYSVKKLKLWNSKIKENLKERECIFIVKCSRSAADDLSKPLPFIKGLIINELLNSSIPFGDSRSNTFKSRKIPDSVLFLASSLDILFHSSWKLFSCNIIIREKIKCLVS